MQSSLLKSEPLTEAATQSRRRRRHHRSLSSTDLLALVVVVDAMMLRFYRLFSVHVSPGVIARGVHWPYVNESGS